MRILFLLSLALIVSGILKAQESKLTSPDGKLTLSVRIDDKIYYDIACNGELLLKDCFLQMTVDGNQLGEKPRLASKKVKSESSTINPVVPFKFSTVDNTYNQLLLTFKGGYSVEFRAYDEGIAYRFVTNLKGDKQGKVQVQGETFAINFPSVYLAHLQQAGSFKTNYEESYSHLNTNEWSPSDKMSNLPVLLDTKKDYKILISEFDVFDYPCLFLKGTGTNGMTSVSPKVPLEFGEDGDRSLKILKEADYIAKTAAKRSYPWRYFMIAKNDGELVENTMPVKLAPKSELKDVSWIKPGQVSWEWWNDASPYGPDVNFVSGYNLDTYKYYIDFASQFGIPYIIMDEGWAMTVFDPYTPNPKVDVHELIRYGKEKNVGIILWLTWLCVENHMDVFKTFAEWGVKGVKIDFMDRSDQWMVDYYERVAKEAAKYNILVDFHGSFKPAGLEYRYPNVLSYEGVRGLEQMSGCQPNNTIYLPFMRNAVGPMDFTPGAMINMQPNVYCGNRPNSASVGTRAYQMALFVLFESGLQMLCDNPTLYYNNRECTEFITKVPVTWDETKALAAEAGEVIVVAKRKGDKWYIGGITNGKERELIIRLDFLNGGKTYTMTHFEDGINAGRQAMDYRRKTSQVKKADAINIKMVRNGGWAAVIE
ncbi:glycoside hydrolase family 97 protein [Dysgonomonas sp. 25]|uniref:glycoside hydrolase family 97 protein n=1 Tax=Dysgonomonas sp. 25 TaxID=2302933 RepID=UPI001629D306|nr:glycoside hydrolase family 97 protein [Dysgonomonas sp. 25]NDV69381.1 glycoside hydrolase family 97 protein [Dysgonomonas sp. 25]